MTQAKNNPRNDRVKREYLIWLKEAKQRSAATMSASSILGCYPAPSPPAPFWRAY
jgi:hypothetical protein